MSLFPIGGGFASDTIGLPIVMTAGRNIPNNWEGFNASAPLMGSITGGPLVATAALTRLYSDASDRLVFSLNGNVTTELSALTGLDIDGGLYPFASAASGPTFTSGNTLVVWNGFGSFVEGNTYTATLY